MGFKNEAEARDWAVFLASTNDGGGYDEDMADEMLEAQRERSPTRWVPAIPVVQPGSPETCDDRCPLGENGRCSRHGFAREIAPLPLAGRPLPSLDDKAALHALEVLWEIVDELSVESLSCRLGLDGTEYRTVELHAKTIARAKAAAQAVRPRVQGD